MTRHRWDWRFDREVDKGVGSGIVMGMSELTDRLERLDVLPRPMLTWIEFNHCWHDEVEKSPEEWGSVCPGEDRFDQEPAFWAVLSEIGAPQLWVDDGRALAWEWEAKDRGFELRSMADADSARCGGLLPPTAALELRSLADGKGEAARKAIAKKTAANKRAPKGQGPATEMMAKAAKRTGA